MSLVVSVSPNTLVATLNISATATTQAQTIKKIMYQGIVVLIGLFSFITIIIDKVLLSSYCFAR